MDILDRRSTEQTKGALCSYKLLLLVFCLPWCAWKSMTGYFRQLHMTCSRSLPSFLDGSFRTIHGTTRYVTKENFTPESPLPRLTRFASPPTSPGHKHQLPYIPTKISLS